MPDASVVALREWDTAFFGLRIAHHTDSRLTAESAAAAAAWCAANAVDLCVLLADTDTETAHEAVRNGYFALDLRLVLDCDVRQASLPAPRRAVRAFRPDDLPALERIAATSFADSRFSLDPYFPKARVPEMYRRWLHQRCMDVPDVVMRPADAVFVADGDDGQPAGFLTALLLPSADNTPLGCVDLVAVDGRTRGQYIGESMTRTALRWFAEQGCHTVEVVTQGRNVAAQRTYQRCGFAVRRAQMWYHKWWTQHDQMENSV